MADFGFKKAFFDIEKQGLSPKKGSFSILFVVILICYLGQTSVKQKTSSQQSWFFV
jgi:uncharacterized protein YprB with RNaseH-like and TPR domain